MSGTHLSIFKKTFLDYKTLLIVGFCYALLLSVLALINGAALSEFSFLLDCFGFILTFLIICFGVVLSFFLVRSFFKARKEKTSASKLFDASIQEWLTPQREALIAVGAILIVEMQFFPIGKCLITVLNPYKWDLFFSHIDYLVHGKFYPHEWVTPIVEKFHLTKLLEGAYLAWFPFMLSVFAWCVFWDSNSVRQKRFLWAFFLTWAILGTVMAILFSSAGPYFLHIIDPQVVDPYAGLVSHLQDLNKQSPLTMMAATQVLIEFFQDDTLLDLNAMSAMPSLHVATICLIALYARHIHKYFFAFSVLFAAVIFTGAVYFGWHYAVDAYVSVIVTTLIWKAVGKMLA